MKFIAAIAALAISSTSHAAIVSAFSEDFEGTLSAWTDRTPEDPEAAIVADPLRPGNRVLSFNRLGSGGSIYTNNFITTGGDFTVSFEYLGLPQLGGTVDNLGGFFGISEGLPGTHYWVAGTGSFPVPIDLIDDGSWHTYSLTFASPIGQVVHLLFEDFIDSGGVAGDVYFDNIRFNDTSVQPAPLPHSQSVPEPGSLVLTALGCLAIGYHRRQRATAPSLRS